MHNSRLMETLIFNVRDDVWWYLFIFFVDSYACHSAPKNIPIANLSAMYNIWSGKNYFEQMVTKCVFLELCNPGF